ncbi:hypothetical protein A0H81_04685 [Grifola frondosa]|uniref:Uncharacterized protein n=1 Tax=Grifola frondosa TaxID=5627 RepID=A0A1C7MFT0_GRIFR|nr:hypothetical protein A0H81_04685 [Grifola frondosa]
MTSMGEQPADYGASGECTPCELRITNHGKMAGWVTFALDHFEKHANEPLVLHTLPIRDAKPAAQADDLQSVNDGGPDTQSLGNSAEGNPDTLAHALQGDRHLKQKRVAFMRVTLCRRELPTLVTKGATYQRPDLRRLSKSARARMKRKFNAQSSVTIDYGYYSTSKFEDDLMEHIILSRLHEIAKPIHNIRFHAVPSDNGRGEQHVFHLLGPKYRVGCMLWHCLYPSGPAGELQITQL